MTISLVCKVFKGHLHNDPFCRNYNDFVVDWPLVFTQGLRFHEKAIVRGGIFVWLQLLLNSRVNCKAHVPFEIDASSVSTKEGGR